MRCWTEPQFVSESLLFEKSGRALPGYRRFAAPVHIGSEAFNTTQWSPELERRFIWWYGGGSVPLMIVGAHYRFSGSLV
jgi:hypothetical protein